MSIKYVYLFANGEAEGNGEMKDLLGGKGAGLAEMTNAGLPVPPGFTITTQACNAYYASGEQFPEGMWNQVLSALKKVEQATGKEFGGMTNPLLVSVRSGAKFSMPGMMDTVLNLGLNEETLQGLARLTANERFALDAYRRFIQMFGKIVMGVAGDLFEQALENEFPFGQFDHLDGGPGQVAVRRDQLEVVQLRVDHNGGKRLAQHQGVVYAALEGALGHSQTAGAIGLGVRVDHEHLHVGEGQSRREVYGGGGLSHSALLVRYGYGPAHRGCRDSPRGRA